MALCRTTIKLIVRCPRPNKPCTQHGVETARSLMSDDYTRDRLLENLIP
jgi:hypothetical protein